MCCPKNTAIIISVVHCTQDLNFGSWHRWHRPFWFFPKQKILKLNLNLKSLAKMSEVIQTSCSQLQIHSSSVRCKKARKFSNYLQRNPLFQVTADSEHGLNRPKDVLINLNWFWRSKDSKNAKKVPKICFIDFITFKILSAIYVCTINNPILKMSFFFLKKKR